MGAGSRGSISGLASKSQRAAMTIPRWPDRGVALIVVVLTMVLLSALGVALVLATSAETRIAGNFRTAQQTLYAAEAAADRAIDDLALVPDWTTLLGGGVFSSFVDGPPGGPATAPARCRPGVHKIGSARLPLQASPPLH